jgi:hypothetical protein
MRRDPRRGIGIFVILEERAWEIAKVWRLLQNPRPVTTGQTSATDGRNRSQLIFLSATALRSSRVAAGMSRTDVGAVTGIMDIRIARYDSGGQRVPPRQLMVLVRVFGSGLEALVPSDAISSAARVH